MKSMNPPEKRDYRKEYLRDQKKRIGYRTELGIINRARQKAGTARVGDGKDEAHVKDVRKGGLIAGKTKMQPASKNRAWRSGKKGYDR